MSDIKSKTYKNAEKEEIPFPKLIDYGDIQYTPDSLEDINKDEGDQFAQNITDISGNKTDIAVNAGGIAVNVSDISGNTSSISINTTNINLKVEKNDVINQINISTEGIRIDASVLTIAGTTVFTSGWESASNVGSLAVKNTADYGSDVSGTKPPTNADHTADIVGDMAYEDLVEVAKLGITIISGGVIKTSLLTANNIITTSASGKRIKISSSPQNAIVFYDGDSEKGRLEIIDDGDSGYHVKLGGDAGALEMGVGYGASSISYISMPFFEGAGKASTGAVGIIGGAGESVGLSWWGGNPATFKFDLGTSLTKVGSHLIPSSTYNLGSSANKWQTIYASGAIYCGGNLVLSADVNPASDSSDLGQSYDYFHQLYANLVKYKTIGSFQHHDDIQLIKNIKTKNALVGRSSLVKVDSKKQRKITKRKDIKKEVWDEATMPKEVYEDGFYDAGAINGLLIGTVKQLIEKVEDLEDKINK